MIGLRSLLYSAYFPRCKTRDHFIGLRYKQHIQTTTILVYLPNADPLRILTVITIVTLLTILAVITKHYTTLLIRCLQFAI